MGKIITSKEASYMHGCMGCYTDILDLLIVMDVPRTEIWTFEKHLEFIKKRNKLLGERKHLKEILLPNRIEAYRPELHRDMKEAEESGRLETLKQWL